MSTALEGHLEVPECINYDWVHSALQHGVLNCEVEALLSETEVSREDLQTFLADKAWEFPGARRQQGRQLRSVRRPTGQQGDTGEDQCLGKSATSTEGNLEEGSLEKGILRNVCASV